MDLERAREILLNHARHPRNLAEGDEAEGSITGECRNPVCGDYVRVIARLEDDRISECRLVVQGCTMCTASASVMSEKIKGLRVSDVELLRSTFTQALLSQGPWPLPHFSMFENLRVNRARIPCALIGWQALKVALNSVSLPSAGQF